MRYSNMPLTLAEAESMLNVYSHYLRTCSLGGVSVRYCHSGQRWSVECSVATKDGVRLSVGEFGRLHEAAQWLVKQSNWRARDLEDAL